MLLCCALAATAIACDKGSGSGAAKGSHSAANVLDEYEALRRMLAEEKVTGANDAAARLADAARGAIEGAPLAQRPHLESIAKPADILKRTPEDNLDALREQFAPLSQHVVALLLADASLRANRRIFHCPMVEGYGKWVQASTKAENPYLGTSVDCGRETGWQP
jgi:hypothetical protein